MGTAIGDLGIASTSRKKGSADSFGGEIVPSNEGTAAAICEWIDGVWICHD
jgi:hypothetical protein